MICVADTTEISPLKVIERARSNQGNTIYWLTLFCPPCPHWQKLVGKQIPLAILPTPY